MSNEPVTEEDDGQNYFVWVAIMYNITYHDVSIRTVPWIRHWWCHNVGTITIFFPGTTVIWREWESIDLYIIFEKLWTLSVRLFTLFYWQLSCVNVMFLRCSSVSKLSKSWYFVLHTELFNISILKLVFAHKKIINGELTSLWRNNMTS